MSGSMIDSDGFSSPPRHPRHERDAAMRAYVGSGSGGNKEAIRLQRESMRKSEEQFNKQMAFQEEQLAEAKRIKPPTFAPASPLVTATPEAYNAGLEQKRNAKRRFGAAATNLTVMPMGGAAYA